MTERLDLYLAGVLCGQISQKVGGSLEFEYSTTYSEEYTPLSLSMPVQVRRHRNKAIRAYLEGLLPDSENALKALGKRFGESPNSPFAILKHIGREVAGAIEMYPEGETPTSNSDDKSFRRITVDEIENQLRGKITEYADGVVVNQNTGKISIAGAQPKIGLHKSKDGEWYFPSDLNPSTHILKPLTDKLKNQDIVEHLTLQAARNLGLEVCDSTVEAFNSLRVFVARRYDREYVQELGITRKLHQEDLCQSLSVTPNKKYQLDDGGPGVGEIARLISKLPILDDRNSVARSFFEGLVFNVYARCPDAHAKNYSLILAGKTVRLAPLYDLTTGAPYGFSQYSAMSVNRKYEFSRISEDDLLVEAKRLSLDPEWAKDRIQVIHRGILGAFVAAEKDIEIGIENSESVKNVMIDIERVFSSK